MVSFGDRGVVVVYFFEKSKSLALKINKNPSYETPLSIVILFWILYIPFQINIKIIFNYYFYYYLQAQLFNNFFSIALVRVTEIYLRVTKILINCKWWQTDGYRERTDGQFSFITKKMDSFLSAFDNGTLNIINEWHISAK